MKYYRFQNTVIEFNDNVSTQIIVDRMRRKVNSDTFHPITIMIEDIEESDEFEYLQCLLDKVDDIVEKESGYRFTTCVQLHEYVENIKNQTLKPKN